MFAGKSHPYVIQKLHSNSLKHVYLTFDDGPDPRSTPAILDLLEQLQISATFFVIGNQARIHSDLIRRMLLAGHEVFSHSIDHRYAHYFKAEAALRQWIEASLKDLEQITQRPQTVFRPPAGVLTPPLLCAARSLQAPLVLWNHRFFDTVLEWNMRRAEKSLRRLAPGDLILLHDRQKTHRLDRFLFTLKNYIQSAQDHGFELKALSNNLLQQEISHVSSSSL